MSTIDQQFVEYIVKTLVSDPDAVQINRRIDEKGVLLELTVDPNDLGRVIGKRGATAQSLRTLLRALGTKNDARYNLKIVDNDNHDGTVAQSTNDDNEANSTNDQNDNLPTNDQGGTVEDESKNQSSEKTPIDKPEGLASKTRKELAELDDLDV